MNEMQNAKTSGRRGLRIALILSLAVNLMLIGVLVGGVIRYAHRPPTVAMQTDFRNLWRALPSDARTNLRETVRDPGFPSDRRPRPSREERRERVERMNADIIAALRADPFDGEVLAVLLDGERDAITRRMQAARAAFVAQVAALSSAERAEMARSLERAWDDRLPQR